VHEPVSIVSKIIKAKYFTCASLWTAPSYVPKFTFSSSIQSVRHHLEKYITIQFIKVNTSVWNQPWSLVSNLERDAR
jgi:hypothetical protein